MPEQFLDRSTFAGGEAAPTLHARSDLARYQVSVAAAENMVVLYEGGLTRRPGTRFVLELKDQTQVGEFIPFRFSGSQAYMLVLNGGKARVLKGGGFLVSAGVPYEFNIPWAAADLANIRPCQLPLNVIFAACKGYRVQVITRFADTNWSVGAYDTIGGPVDLQNLDQTKTISVAATTGSNITMLASVPIFDAGDVGSVWRLDEQDLSGTPYWRANDAILAAGALRRFQNNTYRAEIDVPSGHTAGATAPTHLAGAWVDDGDGNGFRETWTFLHSGYGYVRIDSVTSSSSVQVTILSTLPDSVVSTATWRWSPGAWSVLKGYPTNLTFFQQSLIAGRNDTFWKTVPASNVDYSIYAEAARLNQSGIAAKLTAQSGSLPEIRWLGASENALLAGTADGEWAITAQTLGEAITVSNILPREGSGKGAAPTRTERVDNGVFFFDKARKKLFYVNFDPVNEKLNPVEVTKGARHILKGLGADMGWQQAPNRVLWIGCQDGALVGLTWMPEEQVIAFHEHPLTNGYVERVRAIASTDEGKSEVYMIVRRVVGGVTKRYVEYLSDFFGIETVATDGTAAWFLDCALQYTGAPVSRVTGFNHLIGETVGVFVDGATHPDCVVDGAGGIDLQRAGSTVLAGYKIPWRVKSLPLDMASGQQSSRGATKGARYVQVDVLNSAGGTISVNGGKAEALQRAGARAPGTPVPLLTGPIKATPLGHEELSLQWEIKGSDPLPFCLRAVTVSADIEGE